ncbi:MAG TPA: hypothetical protein VH879_13705 [Gemmatimonadales bacterium]|jgi:hypothetical protein
METPHTQSHHEPDSTDREAFAAFLDRVADTGSTPEEYQAFAVTHYADARLESARVQLVRSVLASLAGPALASSLATQLRALAHDLRHSEV